MPWRNWALAIPFNSYSLGRLWRTVGATVVKLRCANESVASFHRCMMTLIHGAKGKCLCPVCIVPLKELSELSKTFPIRTIGQAIEGYEAYLKKKSQGEEILKALGLRPVKVGHFQSNLQFIWWLTVIECILGDRKLRTRRSSQFWPIALLAWWNLGQAHAWGTQTNFEGTRMGNFNNCWGMVRDFSESES